MRTIKTKSNIVDSNYQIWINLKQKGDEGSDIGALIGAVTGVVTNLFGVTLNLKNLWEIWDS